MKKVLWNNLLRLRHQIGLSGDNFRFCQVDMDIDELPQINDLTERNDSTSKQVVIFRDKLNIPHSNIAKIAVDPNFNVSIQSTGNLDDEDIQDLKVYLPYCFLSLLARKEKRAISVAHFAQSLDGKIATFSGDSKWIGNEENLIHAHRMRALTDGIMIGSGTLRSDQPRLNVRLVEGANPTRIVIGSLSEKDCSCLRSISNEPVVVIGKEKQCVEEEISFFALPYKDNKINCTDILTCLFEQGIHTVYLEGGAMTTSNFLKESAIDIFQLHISPQIFGSGKSAICLPQISEVGEAIQFQKFSFEPVGNTMMFVGRLNGLAV